MKKLGKLRKLEFLNFAMFGLISGEKIILVKSSLREVRFNPHEVTLRRGAPKLLSLILILEIKPRLNRCFENNEKMAAVLMS